MWFGIPFVLVKRIRFITTLEAHFTFLCSCPHCSQMTILQAAKSRITACFVLKSVCCLFLKTRLCLAASYIWAKHTSAITKQFYLLQTIITTLDQLQNRVQLEQKGWIFICYCLMNFLESALLKCFSIDVWNSHMHLLLYWLVNTVMD